MMCGGCSPAQPATPEIQTIADKVKPQLEEQANRKYSLFKAVEFTSQLVAGTNYFIKVQVDSDDFVHLRVLESPSHEMALQGYQTDKSKGDKLTAF